MSTYPAGPVSLGAISTSDPLLLNTEIQNRWGTIIQTRPPPIYEPAHFCAFRHDGCRSVGKADPDPKELKCLPVCH